MIKVDIDIARRRRDDRTILPQRSKSRIKLCGTANMHSSFATEHQLLRTKILLLAKCPLPAKLPSFQGQGTRTIVTRVENHHKSPYAKSSIISCTTFQHSYLLSKEHGNSITPPEFFFSIQ